MYPSRSGIDALPSTRRPLGAPYLAFRPGAVLTYERELTGSDSAAWPGSLSAQCRGPRREGKVVALLARSGGVRPGDRLCRCDLRPRPDPARDDAQYREPGVGVRQSWSARRRPRSTVHRLLDRVCGHRQLLALAPPADRLVRGDRHPHDGRQPGSDRGDRAVAVQHSGRRRSHRPGPTPADRDHGRQCRRGVRAAHARLLGRRSPQPAQPGAQPGRGVGDRRQRARARGRLRRLGADRLPGLAGRGEAHLDHADPDQPTAGPLLGPTAADDRRRLDSPLLGLLPLGSAPPRRRAIVAIGVGAVTIDSALLGLIAPLLPEIEARTGAGDAALGLALAAYAVAIAVLSLPLGRAADAVGRRALLVAGLLIVAIGSVLVAISDSIGILMAARAVQGVGSAASWISALALVSDTAPPGHRGEALGVALGATSAGSIAGPALGGVTAQLLSFEAPFLILCGLALALLLWAPAILPHGGAQTPSPVPALPAIIRSNRSGVGAWAATIMFGGASSLGLVEVVAPLDLN